MEATAASKTVGDIARHADTTSQDEEMAEPPQELYEQAQARVRETPELAEHEAFILADWCEGADHLRWVVDAPVAEIVDWIEAGK